MGGYTVLIFSWKNRAYDHTPGFISSSWQITSREKFAASCIGVLCLGIFLEFLGRVGNTYDKYILRQFQYVSLPSSDGEENIFVAKTSSVTHATNDDLLVNAKSMTHLQLQVDILSIRRTFQPSMGQQVIRAGIHMLRFGITYLIMLLFMTLNGFLILGILAGAYMGSFIFGWKAIATR